MIALYIISAIILLILFIFFLPIGMRIKYEETLFIWLKLGTISLNIFPNQKNKHSDHKAYRRENPRKSNRKIKTKNKPHLLDIINVVKTGTTELTKFLKKLHFKKFNLSIVVSDEDAAKASINYGIVCGVISTFYSIVESRLNLNNTDVSVDLDYSGKTVAKLDIILNTITINALCLAVKILLIALPLLKNDDKKGGKINE